MKHRYIQKRRLGALALLGCLSIVGVRPTVAQENGIVHDAEFYVLQAQHGES